MLTLSAALAAPQLRLPGSNTTLQGALIFDERWSVQNPDGTYPYPVEAGIYSLQARPDGKLTRQQNINDFIYMKAGVSMPGGLYYTFSAQGAETAFYFACYSSSNWSRRSREEIDKVNMPSDLTYDPVTRKVYGFFWNDDDQEYSRFCSISMSSAEAQDIGRGMDRNSFAIAANAKGEIYGVWGYTGWLIKVDPKTGNYEQIGRLGVAPGEDSNTLTFDDATGKLYWTTSEDRDSKTGTVTRKAGLYEVNTATGAATLIRDFDNSESFAGMYALPYTVPADAPAECTGVSCSFAAIGSTEATISFTAPALTSAGSPLSGTLDVIVEVNGQTKVVEGVSPGARASATVSLAEGINEGTLTACTAAARGVITPFTTFAGEDLPGAPADVRLTDAAGKPHLSWKAPAAGKNGGMFDTSSLRYRIVRQSDRKETARDLTATEWTDESFTGTAALSYAVYAYTAKGESEPTLSEKLIFGEGFTIPFTEGFDTRDAFDLWTVVNPNGKTTWEYSSSAKNIYSKYDNNNSEADDWIFSPRFSVKKGQTYRLEFDANTSYDSQAKYAEDFEWWLSSTATSEGKLQRIAEYKDFLGRTVRHLSAIFKAEADGRVHLGLFTNSPGTHWQLNIDNISLSEVDSRVPAAVCDLKLTPAAHGELSVVLTATAPKTDADDKALTENMSVKIYREQQTEPAATLTEIAPGQSVSWTDTPAEAGVKSYRVVAATLAGDGAEATASTYVGVDAPGAPVGLKAVESADGVTLSWAVNPAGANGGWYDPSQMTYRIVRSDGQVLQTEFKGTSYTDSSLKLTRQELLYYLVTPYCGSVKGAFANTPYEVYGPAYAAPLAETFAGADMKWYPWVSESDGPMHVWSLETSGVSPQTADSNGDNGLVMFTSNETTKGITGTFASPKFDLSNVDSPALSFSMYHSTAADATVNEGLTVYYMTPGSEWQKLTGSPILRDNGTKGWQRHSLDIPVRGVVRVMFEAKALGGGNIHLDDIRIDSRRDIDAELTSLNVPSKVAAGEQFPLTARISNAGSRRISAVLVKAEAGGELLASKSIDALDPGATAEITLTASITAKGNADVKVTATADGDANAANNSAQATVKVVEPVIPGIGALEGVCSERDGKTIVDLTWEGPADRAAVTDDFESYKDWAVSGFGDWLTVDLDRDVTVHINKDLETYPDMNSPKAWQVCNARTLGIDIWTQGQPHSGNKMLMSVANINTANDDWLISPMLNGARQTVSFYAKAFTEEDVNEERMAVYSSTGSTDPADFVKISPAEYIVVPDSWQRYSFPLAEGTRRFAIRCMSNDAFALFVDDACFNDLTVAPVELSHYEVMRDGVKIGETSDPRFSDDISALSGVSYKYSVKAVYDRGREATAPAIEVIVKHGGVDELENKVNVYAIPGAVVIRGAEGLPYELTTPAGVVLARGMVDSAEMSIPCAPGILLLRVGNSAYKLRSL